MIALPEWKEDGLQKFFLIKINLLFHYLEKYLRVYSIPSHLILNEIKVKVKG